MESHSQSIAHPCLAPSLLIVAQFVVILSQLRCKISYKFLWGGTISCQHEAQRGLVYYLQPNLSTLDLINRGYTVALWVKVPAADRDRRS